MLIWNVPAEQLVHAADETVENMPKAQLTHLEDATSRIVGEYDPAEHPTHAAEPVLL